MEHLMNGHSKLCGTCEYWMGQRQPNFYSTSVIFSEPSVKGKCWCLTGPHARADRYSNFTVCTCYKKWSLLKV